MADEPPTDTATLPPLRSEFTEGFLPLLSPASAQLPYQAALPVFSELERRNVFWARNP